VEFLSQHQLYIVMLIVVAIWLGIYGYLFRLDSRIKKLEQHTKQR
jgi:CcmD family protein